MNRQGEHTLRCELCNLSIRSIVTVNQTNHVYGRREFRPDTRPRCCGQHFSASTQRHYRDVLILQKPRVDERIDGGCVALDR